MLGYGEPCGHYDSNLAFEIPDLSSKFLSVDLIWEINVPLGGVQMDASCENGGARQILSHINLRDPLQETSAVIIHSCDSCHMLKSVTQTHGDRKRVKSCPRRATHFFGKKPMGTPLRNTLFPKLPN